MPKTLPAWVVALLAVVYTTGIVALFASSRLVIEEAGLLLALPTVLAIAALRPEWIVYTMLIVPPSLLASLKPRQMTAILLAALFGFMLDRGLRPGPKTGVYALVGIILLALAMKADASAAGAQAADSTLKYIVYYVLLMLVAFHSAANGRIRTDALVNAFLLGIVLATIIHPFAAGAGFPAVGAFVHTQFSYLAAMGFGVSYARSALRRFEGGHASDWDHFLTVVYLLLTAIAFVRVGWMAVLMTFALVSLWTGRKTFWVVGSLFVVLVLTVPLVGERVLPGGSIEFSEEGLRDLTTGRSQLWGELYARGADALPFGNGWGYVWSLSSEQLLGFEGGFGTEEGGLLYPHSDFLFLFVELGIPGVALLIMFWLHLFRTARRLTRGIDEQARYGVRILAPVMIVMLLVQLFDNGFAIRFVAERFFIAAGFVFGLEYASAEERSRGADARSLDTS